MHNNITRPILLVEDNPMDVELTQLAFARRKLLNPLQKKAYSLGANSYIIKPVDFDKFMQVAEQIELYWVALNTLPNHLEII